MDPSQAGNRIDPAEVCFVLESRVCVCFAMFISSCMIAGDKALWPTPREVRVCKTKENPQSSENSAAAN